MKIEWLVANITAVGFPDRAEHAFFGSDFGWAIYWPIQAIFVVREPLCDQEPPLEPNKFTQGHLMKIKWLAADITAVGSPDIAERAILRVILTM